MSSHDTPRTPGADQPVPADDAAPTALPPQDPAAVVAEMDARIVDVDAAAAAGDAADPTATDRARTVPGAPEPPD